MFRSNVSSKFLYFVRKVFNEHTGKVSTRLGNILGGCLFECALTIWCSSLLEDARAILSVQNLHLAVYTSFGTLCLACLYKSLKIVNFVFLHFLSALRLSLLAIEVHHEEDL